MPGLLNLAPHWPHNAVALGNERPGVCLRPAAGVRSSLYISRASQLPASDEESCESDTGAAISNSV